MDIPTIEISIISVDIHVPSIKISWNFIVNDQLDLSGYTVDRNQYNLSGYTCTFNRN